MNLSDWTFLAVVSDGEALEIGGTDVWWLKWQRLDIGTLQVPHPNHQHQTHTLRPYAIELSGDPILFCAGELSSNVWCFYVPAKGQPSLEFKGMTVNERLYATNLLDAFGLAITARNKKRATDILIAAGFNGQQADETAGSVLKNPDAYGY